MEYYSGKVVLITGASSGLGLAMVKLLFQVDGCKIIASSRSPSKLRSILNSWNGAVETCKCILLDLESDDKEIAAQVTNAFSFYDRVDVLINCAGMGFRGRIHETLADVDRRMMQVDYFGQITVIKSVLAVWQSRNTRHGDIIQISSVQGFFGLGERAPYSAAKHALTGFIDSLRVEHDRFPDPSPFKIIHVCPGHIATNHSLNSIRGDGSTYDAQDETTLLGYSPDYVAKRCLERASKGEREIVIADFKIRILIFIRYIAPTLCFRLLRNRFLVKKESLVKTILKWVIGLA